VIQLLEEDEPSRAGIFEDGPISLLVPRLRALGDDIEVQTGLDISLAYTVLLQSTTGKPGPQTGVTGDFDLLGTWRLLGEEDEGNRGRLVFAIEHRHQIGDNSALSLFPSSGTLGPLADGFGERPLVVKQLYWRQELLDSRVVLSAGKVDAGDFHNQNRLSSVNTSLINPYFATNVSRGFPGNGIGGNVTIRPDERWYASAGIYDRNGRVTTGDFRDLDRGEFVYAFDIGLTPQSEDERIGNYRLTLWYSDERSATGVDEDLGFALSVDQDIAEGVSVFGRYGHARGDARGVDNTLSIGLGVEGPFERPDDFLVAGLAWGSPRLSSNREEFAAEILYRAQLTPVQQLSVGYQVIVNPSRSDDDDVLGVFEARWRVAF
jgi:hypothetical protein